MTHTVVHTVKPSPYNDPVTDDSVGALYRHLEDVMINAESCFHDCSLLIFPFKHSDCITIVSACTGIDKVSLFKLYFAILQQHILQLYYL